MEGRCKVSAVFWPTHFLLDLRNTSQEHFSWTWLVSRVLHSNKRLIFLKISMGSSWEVSLFPRTQRRWKWAPVCCGRGKRGLQLWVNAAPHVCSLLTLSPLKMCNVMEQKKLPLQDAFVGDQEKSRAQLESRGVSSALAVAHNIWTEQFHPCVCKECTGQNKKIQFIPWSYDFVFRGGKVKNLASQIQYLWSSYNSGTLWGDCKYFFSKIKKIIWE